MFFWGLRIFLPFYCCSPQSGVTFKIFLPSYLPNKDDGIEKGEEEELIISKTKTLWRFQTQRMKKKKEEFKNFFKCVFPTQKTNKKH